MKRRHRFLLPSLLILMFQGEAPAMAQQLPPEVINWPDTIYTNAIVVTLDEHELNDDPGTIAEAIARAGGTTKDGDRQKVRVIRSDRTGVQHVFRVNLEDPESSAAQVACRFRRPAWPTPQASMKASRACW